MTIARQLAQVVPSLTSHIVDAITASKDPSKLSIPAQLRDLILTPLQQISDVLVPIVVVVDALDECSDQRAVGHILSLLSTTLRELPLILKFFVTSRPEQIIKSQFHFLSTQSISDHVILHDIERGIVDNDIKVFLQHRLVDEEVEPNWPTEGQLS